MLTVNIRERDGGERRLVFGTEEVTIGRAKGSDILLPRNNISKRHARLVDRDDKVVLVDLRSTNGTYVNGRRITAPEVVGPKDKIYIGDFVMKVESVKSPEQEHTMPQSPVNETAMMDPAPLDDVDLPVEPTEGSPVVEEDEHAPEPRDALEEADDATTGPTTDPGRQAGEAEAAQDEPEDAEEDEASAQEEDAAEGDEPEPTITPEDIFDEEATAALDLEELGISAEEADEVALAPTQHRGMNDDQPPAEDIDEEDSASDEEEPQDAEPEDAEPEDAEPEDAEPEDAEPEDAEPEDAEPEDAASDEAPAPEEAIDDDGIAFEEFEIDLEDDSDLDVEDLAGPKTRTAPPPPESTAPAPAAQDAPPLTAQAIDTLMGDVTVDGILINATDSVVVRRGHASTVIPGAFPNQAVLDELAIDLAKRAGFEDLGSQMLDGALPDGIALHIIPRPLAPEGPIVTLSRASAKAMTADDLRSNASVSDELLATLESAVAARKNIVVASARGGGRSTVLNALGHLIPADERVALVEDARELALPHRDALRLDKGALNDAGESVLDIVPQLSADRVLIDPVSAEDVVEFVGLALGGHDGLMVTFRGQSATTVLRRMSLAVELSVGAALGERARDMVAEAVDLIVVVDHTDNAIVLREVISVDDAGPFGFRTTEILAQS